MFERQSHVIHLRNSFCLSNENVQNLFKLKMYWRCLSQSPAVHGFPMALLLVFNFWTSKKSNLLNKKGNQCKCEIRYVSILSFVVCLRSFKQDLFVSVGRRRQIYHYLAERKHLRCNKINKSIEIFPIFIDKKFLLLFTWLQYVLNCMYGHNEAHLCGKRTWKNKQNITVTTFT